MKEECEHEWENQKKEVNKRVENPELQKIILNLDDDNFKLFIGKLNAMSQDLAKHLTHAMMKAGEDSEKRKKTNKCECFNCHKEYKSKSSLIDLVGLDGIYKRYCDDCCKIQIKDYVSKDILQLKKEVKVDDFSHKDLLEISRVCDVVVQNYIFSHPELLKKVMDSEPMRKMKEELGLNKEENKK